MMKPWRAALLLPDLVLAAFTGPAAAATATEARDLRETVETIAVQVQDAAGRSEALRIPLTLYRPPGDGPFPLAVLAHGRDAPQLRRGLQRLRYETLARYLVGKGFAVALPTRVGYGDTFGPFDPESAGACRSMRSGPVADAAADQLLAAVEHARTLPWVDASRWVVVGQSVGGIAALALAARAPAGLLAAINFSGGIGGNPERQPRAPCAPLNVEVLLRGRAAMSSVPSLWLYWRNDQYWGDEVPRRWLKAYAEGGGRAEFHHLPDAGEDGHQGLHNDMDHWVPLVEAFLRRFGFTQPGGVPRPPASGWARLYDVDRVPLPAAARETYYRRFLEADPPRAFAVGPGGELGFAQGDWALGRALGLCQRAGGEGCMLYAVDHDVVWTGGGADK